MVVVQGGDQWRCQSRNIDAMLRSGGAAGGWTEESGGSSDGRTGGGTTLESVYSSTAVLPAKRKETTDTVKLAIIPTEHCCHLRLMEN